MLKGSIVGKTKRGKGKKLMVLVDGKGTPLGVHWESASLVEVNLLQPTLDNVSVRKGKRRGRPRKKPDSLVMDTDR